jgi:hypothetical protein
MAGDPSIPIHFLFASWRATRPGTGSSTAEETGTSLAMGLARANDRLPATRFETLARRVLAGQYAVALSPGSVPGVRKLFDLVSADQQVVSDAKYFNRVGGVGLPPAKFSIIAEHVWLLEKNAAPPHSSCSEMTARSRCDGSNATVSWRPL